MSQKIHVLFPCQEGKGPEMLALLKEILGDTRAWQGCQSIEAYSNADAPDDVVLWETFDQRSEHEAYLTWRVENGMMEALAPILRSDPQFTYFAAHPDV